MDLHKKEMVINNPLGSKGEITEELASIIKFYLFLIDF